MNAIDLFAGLGGFSEGARAAGVRILCAANHWRAAVDAHQRNHPGTLHVCQDLCQADFTTFPRHDILLASPACQGFSKARGTDRPRHDACRATAWAVIACLEAHRPAFAVIENVPEFMAWALYPAWCQAMAALGYSLSENIVDAASVGLPQHRERVFILATKSRAPLKIVLPERARKSADTICQWNAGKWNPIKRRGRSANTLRRIGVGRAELGARFLVAYYGNERGGRSIHAPLGTVTTRERFALINGDCMRMMSVDEYRAAMGFPASYWIPEDRETAVFMLGNAVCPPVATEILNFIQRAA